jgi:tape measure domain-containing protein
MNEIDKLIVKIEADTKQLKSELDKIQGKIRVTGAAGGAAFAGLGVALRNLKGPALVAGAGIAAIGASIIPIARVGSEFEDLKDSLDVVFGSMDAGSAAMDKVFQFAQTTPFQIEDATKAFISLKSAGIEPSMEMLQTFADTASTSIDQLGAFEALIRIVQRSAAGGMGLEEINQLDDRGIPATKILTEALGKSREELSEFGKTAEGAAAMVKILTDGLQTRFGGAMESKMDNLSTKTSNMTIAFKQLADDVFKSGLGEFLKDMADNLTSAANAIGRMVRSRGGRSTIADITGETDPEKQKTILQTMIDEQRAIFKEASASVAEGFGGQVIADQRKSFNLMNEYLGLFTKLNSKAEDLGGKKTNPLDQGAIEFMSEFNKLLDDSIPEIDKINEKLVEVEGLRGKIGEDGTLLATDEEIERVKTHLKTLRDELDETATFSEEMQQTIINASNAFTTDFVNSLMDGENALQSFKDFSKNIVSQIITIFLQMAVVNRILNSVFGLKGDDALSTFTFGEKASGGKVQKGRPYLVGERGMEMFVPDTGGTIMNNMNTGNAIGGGTTVINQSINFATGVVPTVRAEVIKMMPQIADVTKGAVAEAAMRGGNYRRMLQGG